MSTLHFTECCCTRTAIACNQIIRATRLAMSETSPIPLGNVLYHEPAQKRLPILPSALDSVSSYFPNDGKTNYMLPLCANPPRSNHMGDDRDCSWRLLRYLGYRTAGPRYLCNIGL
jgi:hypothetical protein